MSHLRSTIGNLALVCLGSLFGLLLLEGGLQLRAKFVAPSTTPEVAAEVIPDGRLGYRLNPNFPGHDSRGWRNSSALTSADIVVFGDSQTYGVNLSEKTTSEAAWPQRVGALLHRPIYQMAASGYGPAQYALLMDEALALKPKVIIAAYYYGNDIYDSYQFVYRIGEFKRSTLDTLFDSSFALTDLESQQAITRAEAIDPELLRRKYLDCREPKEVPDHRLQAVRNILASPPLAPLADEGMFHYAMAYLTQHSALTKILVNRFVTKAESHHKAEDFWPKICPRYRDRELTTLFNPGYRILALDETDPRIVEGERITFLAFRHMAERCRPSQCSLYIAMIPTKEMAFRARISGSMLDQPYMVDLWNVETRARSSAREFFAREHIPTIDTLPALESVIASGVNPYPKDADGHPIQAGYDAIARAVAERLERDGMGDKGHAF